MLCLNVMGTDITATVAWSDAKRLPTAQQGERQTQED